MIIKQFSKRHYEAIADIIFLQRKDYQDCFSNWEMGYTQGYTQGCENVAKDLADYFEERSYRKEKCSKSNPNFDKDKFLKSCGVK